MLMLAYGASVGGLLTPVGSPPNLIGRGLIEEATGERISFGQWTLAALPICALMFVVLAVVLWLVPAVVGLAAGTESAAYDWVDNRLDEGVVAVLGASLLFVLPVNWSRQEATMTWRDASRIDWGTILLFGTGIIFGSLLSSTGLAETIGEGASDTLGIASTFAITAFAVALAILISETTSNTASASVVVPIIIPLAVAAGVDPMVPGLAATFAASFGFMLPVSTPQNAVVYGSGCVPITRMIRSGITFDILGGLLIIALLPVMAAVTGLGG